MNPAISMDMVVWSWYNSYIIYHKLLCMLTLAFEYFNPNWYKTIHCWLFLSEKESDFESGETKAKLARLACFCLICLLLHWATLYYRRSFSFSFLSLLPHFDVSVTSLASLITFNSKRDLMKFSIYSLWAPSVQKMQRRHCAYSST